MNQWISCKERLPEDAREVWVTVQGHDVIIPNPGESIQDAVARISRQRWVTKAYWCEGENGWNDPSFGVPLMVQPIAWMDIDRPEPWQGEEPEDDFMNKPEGEEE